MCQRAGTAAGILPSLLFVLALFRRQSDHRRTEMRDVNRLHLARRLSRRGFLSLVAAAGLMLLVACAPAPGKPAQEVPKEGLPTAALAPAKRASLSVLVKDAGSGEPVEGATVRLAHLFAGVREEETTSVSGQVTFPDVPAMSTPYGVTVEKEGYTPQSVKITLQAGENQVDVELSSAS